VAFSGYGYAVFLLRFKQARGLLQRGVAAKGDLFQSAHGPGYELTVCEKASATSLLRLKFSYRVFTKFDLMYLSASKISPQ
jgi:hypothetical protein